MIAWGATFAAVAWLTFLVWYTMRARWWKNPYGRNAFEVSAILWVIVTRVAVVAHFPHLQENKYVGLVVYALAGLFGIRRLILMEQAQRTEGDRLGFPKHKEGNA